MASSFINFMGKDTRLAVRLALWTSNRILICRMWFF